MNDKFINKNDLDSLLVGYVPKRYLTQKEAVHYTGHLQERSMSG